MSKKPAKTAFKRSPERDPSIFRYLSWRDYVRAYLAAVPARTQKLLADHVDVCQAQMSNILNKSKEEDSNAAVTRYVADICLALALEPDEARFFAALVQYRHSKVGGPEHRTAVVIIRSEKRFKEAMRLQREQFEYFRHPFAVTIRELARSPAFRNDARWVRDQLIPRPRLNEVEEALALLTRLGMLRHGLAGRTTLPDEGVVIDDFMGVLEAELRAELDVALKESHSRAMHRALKALQDRRADERYVNGCTTLVPVDAIEDFYRMFREWQMRWTTHAQELDPDALQRSRVYRLNLQFFPLSELVELEDGGEE